MNLNIASSLAFSFSLLASGCDAPPNRYSAEVAYFEDGQLQWDLWGDFTSLETCRSDAISHYNHFLQQKRAQSWSCLLKDGKGGYTSRHQ
jgi:hypothetical protein